MKRKPDTDLVPVNWPVILFMLIVYFPLVLFICIAGEQWFYLFFVAFGLWILMDNARSYHVDSTGITCCFFGIRVSGIAWKDISQAGAGKKGGTGFTAAKPCIFLTIGSAPKADPAHPEGYGLDRKGVLTWDDNKNTRAILAKYYGELDY